ncbi:hypothetical protein ACFVR2_02935 [Gottfriedia sp. NPDC057991]|uniref:hypothetical protein n=1 Tax=Gottfriedia sp. NPDC057991 TaxID=3346298 RepID=UPI0036DECFFA
MQINDEIAKKQWTANKIRKSQLNFGKTAIKFRKSQINLAKLQVILLATNKKRCRDTPQ